MAFPGNDARDRPMLGMADGVEAIEYSEQAEQAEQCACPGERVSYLHELRSRRHVTQHELAERMGFMQSTVSKLEARDDVSLRMLRCYVGALGGELRVTAVFEAAGFGADVFELDILGPDAPPSSR